MALQEEMNGAQRVPVYFKATIQLWETHPNHTRPPMHLSASSIGGPSDAVRPVLPLRKGPATAADHEGYVVHGMDVTVTSRCGDFFCVRGWVRNTAQMAASRRLGQMLLHRSLACDKMGQRSASPSGGS